MVVANNNDNNNNSAVAVDIFHWLIGLYNKCDYALGLLVDMYHCVVMPL